MFGTFFVRVSDKMGICKKLHEQKQRKKEEDDPHWYLMWWSEF